MPRSKRKLARDLIDHGRPLCDQARSHAVQPPAGPADRQSLSERSVSMAAALLPRSRMRPGSRWTEWLFIGRRYLSQIMTLKCNVS